MNNMANLKVFIAWRKIQLLHSSLTRLKGLYFVLECDPPKNLEYKLCVPLDFSVARDAIAKIASSGKGILADFAKQRKTQNANPVNFRR